MSIDSLFCIYSVLWLGVVFFALALARAGRDES